MRNRLAGETSLYLLQHADNPVHWQPWDDEALALARTQQRPVLLSIGYSACHWCHVMAHESFEDPAVAEVMNRHFVNVKVDREERPDLDRVYQVAHQLLTGQPGGWPLTMFLDPDTLVPFYGGTYFPKKPRYGLPGFVDLLHRIAEIFATRRDDLTVQNDKVRGVLASLNQTAGSAALSDQAVLDKARQQLGEQYDSAFGGFGSAPKFPMPATVERLLRGWAASRDRGEPDRDALEMVTNTLTKMARGGIRDHLGGGFCRYSTDRQWMIPHFEKMLYDNAQLLALYSDALALGPDALFEDAVTGTAEWLLREMRHPGGAFHSALDADSEGEEGGYYLWRRDEVKRLLTEDEYLVVETLYGLDKPANFEGRWNLHRYDAWRSVVARLSLTPERADELLESARTKLLAARAERTPPARDEKILTAWNGLALIGLTRAALRLGRPHWLAAAQQAADFLREQVFVDGTLHATWQTGRDGRGGPRFAGYLDDYAFLLAGLLELLTAEWRDVDFDFACRLGELLLERFEDAEAGGFYFTAHDHERLIHRPKPTQDDALPPGNGVAALALSDLGHLLAEQRYLDAAERTLAWARPLMEQYPAGHSTLLTALEARLHGTEQIVIRGPRDALEPWLEAARAGYHPWRRVYGIPYEAERVPPFVPPAGAGTERRVVAYRCEGFSCSAPIESLEAFRGALK